MDSLKLIVGDDLYDIIIVLKNILKILIYSDMSSVIGPGLPYFIQMNKFNCFLYFLLCE